MKSELYELLINEFEKDKDVIKDNLIKAMDVIQLEASDKFGKMELTIKYTKN